MARRGAGGRPRMDGVVAHGSAREMSTCLAGGAEEGAAEMEPELSGWCGAVGICFKDRMQSSKDTELLCG
jgi:hypothetical protein